MVWDRMFWLSKTTLLMVGGNFTARRCIDEVRQLVDLPFI